MIINVVTAGNLYKLMYLYNSVYQNYEYRNIIYGSTVQNYCASKKLIKTIPFYTIVVHVLQTYVQTQ